jgi:hypothetical protein
MTLPNRTIDDITAELQEVSGSNARRRPSRSSDIGALAVEMIDHADMVEMLVAQDHHVDLVRRDADMGHAERDGRQFSTLLRTTLT